MHSCCMAPRLQPVLVVALLFAWASPAVAADPEVEAIVAEADPEAMRVVWTTEDADGHPELHTEPVRDKAAARSVVARELDQPDTLVVAMDRRRKALATNDPLRGEQWALDALLADSVYPLNQGDSPTQARVAVIDSGVDASHPDLGANVLPGWDAIADTPGGTSDGCGHGTHVAGIVSAVTNNGAGASSLAPDAQILPVKFLDAACDGTVADEVEGIYWAVAQGAQVINLSVGGDYDPNEEIAVQYALDNDVAVVAAAGNDGCPAAPQFPAALHGVLGVAAIGPFLEVADFSSCGDWVDVAAPGVDILSTMANGDPTDGCGNDYCFLDGTSMASPYAAAALALAISECSVTGESAVDAVLAKVHDLGPPGRDEQSGAGLVDPLPMLQSDCSNDPPPAYQQLPNSDPVVRWYPNRDSGFTCGGKAINILGTESSDEILGTSGNDVILAGGGSDVIDAAGGNDVVCAGDGNDVVGGGAGSDYLRGQAGRDRLRGELGDDTMYGDSGADDLQAGTGNDRLVGGPDPDYLEGGEGFDRVYYNDHTGPVSVSINNQANSGNSTDGPSGARDRLSFGVNSIVGGPGSDALAGWWGNDRLYGGGGDDRLYGNNGNDHLSGEAGADYFYGGSGKDSLSAKDGIRDHYIDGGSDGDVATVDAIDPKPVSATVVR